MNMLNNQKLYLSYHLLNKFEINNGDAIFLGGGGVMCKN